MATHSSILTWRIPGTGEPGGLPSMYCLLSQATQGGCRVAALALDEGVLLNLFQGFESELIDHLIFMKESVLVKTGCV